MKITTEDRGECILFTLEGRADGGGSREWQAAVNDRLGKPGWRGIVLDLTGVPYISSAGVRVLAHLHRVVTPSPMILVGIGDYCSKVLKISGLLTTWPIYSTPDEAVTFCQQKIAESSAPAHWDELQTVDLSCGTIRIIPGTGDRCSVRVLGEVSKVLNATLTRADIKSKRFSETEYSLGIGGLGGSIEDYYSIMGEMITVGGTMVWLPTDGKDTPDFLTPRTDGGEVRIHTPFSVTVSGDFNLTVVFDSKEPRGTSMTRLYRALFDYVRQTRPGWRGALAIGACAEMGEVYGAGVLKCPIIENKPQNGKLITDPSNYSSWFEYDEKPRLTHVTGLITGIGLDLTQPLDGYDREMVDRCFYFNPANTGSVSELLHNHAVFCPRMRLPQRPTDLEQEIETVTRRGAFDDMRHLFDASTIQRAIIGISLIDYFERDAEV
ncbi:MAG: STAS domain-containing protein [Candidatus Methylacidiphilales bacterium]|nr:STAS domain-containing protein [Candidatus Methylacidiphilales bacterium]